MGAAFSVSSFAAGDSASGIDWVALEGPRGRFAIARTETTIAQFRRFAEATSLVTAAERAGGGQVYEAGWVRKAGWTWRTPFGLPAAGDEPAAHVTFAEAAAFCRWAGGRLPRDDEWIAAGHVEQRRDPPAPFRTGVRYPYPTGASPAGARCLGECGSDTADDPRLAPLLLRGKGHVAAGRTAAGVNGLHDMGGNVWEWVDDPPSGNSSERLTRGGSWWYGAAQMHVDHRQSKPPETAVVYIGFRCARDR